MAADPHLHDERLRGLRMLRLTLAPAAVLLAGVNGGSLAAVFAVAVGYVVVTVAGERGLRCRRFAAGPLCGALVGLDAAAIAGMGHLSGGAASPVWLLAVVHLAAVGVVASRRATLGLALWDTLLLLTVPLDRWSLAYALAYWVVASAVSLLCELVRADLRRRQADLETLARMGHDLGDARTPAEVGAVLLQSLATGFGFRRLLLFTDLETTPHLLTCRVLVNAVVGDFAPSPASVVMMAARQRRTLVVDGFDPDADHWLASVLPSAHDVVVVPLVAEGRTVAVVVAEAAAGMGGSLPRTVEAVDRFAAHAALAVRNALLLEQVHEMAITDGLTALANRRRLDDALHRDVARARRSGDRVSLVLLDIDHFKRLNDTHGHLVGDVVLRQVAAVLREQGREYDTVARFGGEEFAVVLPGCSQSVARHVADRLRAAVEKAETDVPVTASCGVATYPYDADNAAELLAAADRALYASKHAGRNRVTTATDVAADTVAS